MTNIPLNSEGGIEPHLTFCPRCGGETNELTLGVVFKGKDRQGRWHYYNQGQRRRVEKKLGEILSDVQHVEEHERVPASQPCPACQKEMREFAAEVEAGGVYFRCAECGAMGVVKGGTEFAAAVREAHGIPAPEPCGVEFNKCEEHTLGEG